MDNGKKIVEKAELSEEIWSRVEKCLKERKISQSQLQRMCAQHGYRVSQSEISRLYSRKVSLTLYQLAAFSEALGVPALRFLDDGSSEERFLLEGSAFISDPSNDVFKPYFGTFYTLMRSTSSFEEGWLSGKMTFSPDSKRKLCVVAFYVNTGEKSRHNQPAWKKYEGILIISRRMSVSYVILTNKHMGGDGRDCIPTSGFFHKADGMSLGIGFDCVRW